MRFDFSLGATITNEGRPFVTMPPTIWHGIPEDALAKMLQISNGLVKHLDKASNKGGTISLTTTRSVVALDGGTVPPDANGSKTFSGLTRDSLSDYQDALHQAGGELVKMGRENAKKHGKK